MSRRAALSMIASAQVSAERLDLEAAKLIADLACSMVARDVAELRYALRAAA